VGETDHNRSQDERVEFARQAGKAQPGLIREFWDFLRHNKKWWRTPIIIMLLLMGVFVAGGGGYLPFIYALY